MTLNEFINRLSDGAKEKSLKGRRGAVGQCPSCASHGRDRQKSNFSVYEGEDEWLHVHCHAGCSESDILSAMGLSENDRRTETPDARSADHVHHIYTHADGSYACEKIRFIKPDKTKGFFQQVRQIRGVPVSKVWRENDRGKRWQAFPKPEEAGISDAAIPIYNLPYVRKAIEEGKPVVVGEGEKAAETLKALGIAGTCQIHGAGNGKFKPHHARHLIGASYVYIVADRDKPGEAYAVEVFKLLRSEGIPCGIYRSKTTGEHDDAHDHFTAGHSLEDLVKAPDLEPKRGLQVTTFGPNAPFVTPTFLVEPYLPRGKCVLLDADGGVGKTCLALAWAAALSRGQDPITFEELRKPVKTLYLHHKEDGDDELNTVYMANGGVHGMLMLAGKDSDGKVTVFDDQGLCDVMDTIMDTGAELVIVDALYYFLLGVVRETNDALSVIRVLSKLNDIAAKTKCTFWNVRHTSKGQIGKLASELGMGSVAFRNSHRGQIVARKHPTMKGVVWVDDLKGSLLVQQGDPFAYRRVGDHGEIHYVRNIPDPFAQKTDGPEGITKLEQAKGLIREMATGQYVKVTDVFEAAKALGISSRTVKTAQADLGIESCKLRGSADSSWYLHIDPFAEGDADVF